MGYSIRTLATLATQARQFFTQAVPGAIVGVWANTFTILGKVFALLDFEHEMRRQWLFTQLFASTADEGWLIRHGFELGLVPDTGTAAAGTATVPATPGLSVPAGLQFERADGATYTVLVAATVGATATTVDLALQSDVVGEIYNIAAGGTLALIESSAAPEGLGPTATVDAAGIAGGVDAELIEDFRARVLFRKRNPPQGGSAPDYVRWAGEALATVKAVYVDSFSNDTRSVWVCFTVTDQPNGIPSAAEVTTVQDYVDDPVRRPITARVFVTGPTEVDVPVAIKNLAPDTTDVRAAIAAEIAALQIDEIQPATPNTPFTLYIEQIDAAIARATGVGAFTLVAPATDQPFTTGGEMPVLQAPTYS